MRVEPVVCLADEFPIEAPLASSAFVPSDKQDRSASRIKGEGHSPHSVFRIEAKFLHVGVLRIFECVHSGPTQLWPKLLQKFCQRKQFVLDRLR